MEINSSKISSIIISKHKEKTIPVPSLNFQEILLKEINLKKQRKESQKISEKLIDKIKLINALAYSNVFKELNTAIGYASISEIDDEVLVVATYKALQKYFSEIEYRDFYDLIVKYENILKYDPYYRDHFFHTFHVFMIGCYIIDNFYKRFSKYCKKNCKIDIPINSIESAWLLVSAFHDIAIPIQKADDFTERLFQSFIQIDGKIISLDLVNKDILLKYYEHIKRINYLLLSSSKKFNSDKINFGGFLYRSLLDKNHAILSSVILVDKLRLIYHDKLKDVEPFIDIIGLAIMTHDYKIWSNILENKAISFEKYPLSFLLIYCDNIQEFNRTNEFYDINKDIPEIKEFEICPDKNLVCIELIYSNKYCFQKKCHMLKNVMNILNSETIDFQIKLTYNDKETNDSISNIFSTTEVYSVTEKDIGEFKIVASKC